jgi:hypothetical protein
VAIWSAVIEAEHAFNSFLTVDERGYSPWMGNQPWISRVKQAGKALTRILRIFTNEIPLLLLPPGLLN